MIRPSLLLAALAVCVFGLSTAHAAEKVQAKSRAPEKSAPKRTSPKPENLGKFGYWSAHVVYEGKNPVCYMALSARPPESAKNKIKRNTVTLMVSHRPAESSMDVVSYAAGLKFKSGSDVTVQIDDKTFNLFTQGDTAWARDALTDKTIVAAMRGSASQMTFTGLSASGKPFGDTIALKGASAAYYAASKACGLSVEKPVAAKEAPKDSKTKKTTKPTQPKKTTKTKAPATKKTTEAKR